MRVCIMHEGEALITKKIMSCRNEMIVWRAQAFPQVNLLDLFFHVHLAEFSCRSCLDRVIIIRTSLAVLSIIGTPDTLFLWNTLLISTENGKCH